MSNFHGVNVMVNKANLEVARLSQGMSNLEKILFVIQSEAWMCRLASLGDSEYNRVNGTPDNHRPEMFLPPFDQAKMDMIRKNMVSIQAVLTGLQFFILMEGATTLEEIDAQVIKELEYMDGIRNPREYTTNEMMEEYALDIRDGYRKFKDRILYLLMANGSWNGFQAIREDQGFLGLLWRSNLFVTLPLKKLLLDWDQVRVLVKEFLSILKHEDFVALSHEVSMSFQYAKNGTIAPLTREQQSLADAQTVADHPEKS